MRDKAMWEADEDLLYVVEEKNHSVDLTEQGREVMAADQKDFFVLPDLAETAGAIQTDEALSPPEKRTKRLAAIEQDYALKNEQISNVDQLLRAYSLYEKDVEYVIQEGKVVIVDTFTGRLQPGRRFSDGLHQALEAKEGVVVQKETQTLATVTVQNFFRMYEKLSGMTGTAETEEAEFDGHLQAGRGGDPDQPAHRPRGPGRRHLQDQEGEVQGDRRRSGPAAQAGPAGAGGHDHGRGQRAAEPPAAPARHQPQRAQRQAAQDGGGDRGRGGPGGRRDHRHQHGRPRHRHQAGAGGAEAAGDLDRGSQPDAGDVRRPDHRPADHRHRAPREPAHRPPAARPLRPPGRPGPGHLLPLARGRPDAAVQPRAHHQGHGPPRRAGGRGHHPLDGDQGHREGAGARRDPATTRSASTCWSTTTWSTSSARWSTACAATR